MLIVVFWPLVFTTAAPHEPYIYKTPSELIIEGVFRGESNQEKRAVILNTVYLNNEQWTVEGVLTRTRIITEEGAKYKHPHSETKYGYRLGSIEEVEKLGYELENLIEIQQPGLPNDFVAQGSRI